MTEGPEPSVGEYRVRLDVDPAALRWSGSVEFAAPGGPVALDCEGLKVAAVRVGGTPVRFVHDDRRHRLAFDVPRDASADVGVDFAGEVETTNLFGLYRSRHGDGELLTTHCEPTGARRIFPCVDRPDRKARILLTVRAPADLEVIANAPVRQVRPSGGHREWTFEPTPEMSTYLFYLGVGRFDFREDRSSAVAIRVATPPGRGDEGSWALRSAGKILRAYETYYGIPYPLPKLDLIAVAEHAFGAMENWGAISFQETRLLVDRASSSFAPRDVFETSAHEIAHQWFGNLVTMAWWDDIWLNESFASLMETKITDALEPTFDPWTDFILRTAGKASAMDGDSLRATHPVRTTVRAPEEISQIFDEISYGKGSTVLAMFDRYLGEEAFRAGVTEYLQRFRFRNARTEDLFAALERASGEPVGRLATPWIDRAGHPVVRARAVPNGIALTQGRFAYLGMPEEEPWPIPMVLDVDGRSERFVFDGREREVAVPAGAPVVLNPGSIGFFRVLYDRPLLDRLLKVLPKRPPLDAWAVLDDLIAFVLSGDADWPTFARAVEALRDNVEPLTVLTLGGALGAFALELDDVPEVGRTARAYLERQVGRLGLDRRADEPPGTGVVRDRLTFARVRVDPGFAAVLAGHFDRWESVDPDLRTAVAIARVRAGGDRAYEEVRAAQAKAASAIEALRFERALAWSATPERVREILDLASAGRLNRSHVLGVAIQASSNPAGRRVAWEWLRDDLERLTGIFRGSGYLPLLLENTLPLIGRGRGPEVRRFFAEHPTPEGTRGLAKGLERLEIVERLAARLS